MADPTIAALAATVADLQRQLKALSRSAQSQHSSVEVNGETVGIVETATNAKEAKEDASAALISANGKNTIHYETYAPTSESNIPGDVWFVRELVGGTVLAQYEGGGGTSWTERPLNSSAVASLDVGKLTTGTLAVGQRVTAGNPTGRRAELYDDGLTIYGDVAGPLGVDAKIVTQTATTFALNQQYFWKVTSTSAAGESLPSAEFTVPFGGAPNTQTLRTNICTNPRASTATGWSSTMGAGGGAATLAANVTFNKYPAPTMGGGASLTFTSTNTGGASIIYQTPVGSVTPGQSYAAGFWYSVYYTASAGRTPKMEFHNASGVSLGIFSGAPVVDDGNNALLYYSIPGAVAPAGSSYVRVYVPGTEQALAGTSFGMVGVLIETRPVGTYPKAYFDGVTTASVGKTFAWSGAANASTSVQTSTFYRKVILSWLPSKGATGYKVYRGTAAGAENILVGTTPTLSFEDTGAVGTPGAPPVSSTSGTTDVLKYANGTLQSVGNIVGGVLSGGIVTGGKFSTVRDNGLRGIDIGNPPPLNPDPAFSTPFADAKTALTLYDSASSSEADFGTLTTYNKAINLSLSNTITGTLDNLFSVGAVVTDAKATTTVTVSPPATSNPYATPQEVALSMTGGLNAPDDVYGAYPNKVDLNTAGGGRINALTYAGQPRTRPNGSVYRRELHLGAQEGLILVDATTTHFTGGVEVQGSVSTGSLVVQGTVSGVDVFGSPAPPAICGSTPVPEANKIRQEQSSVVTVGANGVFTIPYTRPYPNGVTYHAPSPTAVGAIPGINIASSAPAAQTNSTYSGIAYTASGAFVGSGSGIRVSLLSVGW